MKRLFRPIITLISFAAALLLLLTNLTVHVSPDKIWIFAFLGFIFPVIWLANLFLAVLWAVKLRWQFLLPLAAMALTYSDWNNTFQWGGQAIREDSTLQKPLSVMSFNVRLFDIYKWTGEEKVQEKIFELIRKENPDVLCLQEFYSTRQDGPLSENHILARLKQFKYHHIEYRSGKRAKRNFGLVTLSKYPIVEKNSLKFEHTSNFSIQTDIEAYGQRIRIFNNHLESIRFSSRHLNFLDSLNYKNDKERREGLKEITNKMRTAFEHRAEQAEVIGRHIANSAYPAIVCGDFNDTPVSYVYKLMRGRLSDAFVESGKGFGGTYNGKLPSFRIDFIFHDQAFDSFGFKKINVNLSDHYPIMTTLELAGKSSKTP